MNVKIENRYVSIPKRIHSAANNRKELKINSPANRINSPRISSPSSRLSSARNKIEPKHSNEKKTDPIQLLLAEACET